PATRQCSDRPVLVRVAGIRRARPTYYAVLRRRWPSRRYPHGRADRSGPDEETAALRPGPIRQSRPHPIEGGALMARITPTAILLSSALVFAAACSQAEEPRAPAAPAVEANQKSRPPVITAIEAQGLEVIGEFDAPSGLRGYAGVAGQQPVAVYATADGQH